MYLHILTADHNSEPLLTCLYYTFIIRNNCLYNVIELVRYTDKYLQIISHISKI